MKKLVLALVATLAACGPAEDHPAQQSCGPNGECPTGLVCHAADDLCYQDQDLQPPPITALTLSPAPITDATTAKFEFGADQAEATFVCAVDGATATPCVSPLSLTVTEGAHTFTVTSATINGGRGNTVSFSWTVDLSAPMTMILTGPATVTQAHDATFTYVSSEPDSTFQCSLDSAAFAACPATFTVGEGAHTVQVRSIDPAGNVDPHPASYSWTVDNTPPTTTLLSGPAATTNSTRAVFTFSSSEEGTFLCALDGAAAAPCASGDVFLVAAGAHTFTVTAVDVAGNIDPVGASTSWSVDTTIPDTYVDSQPANPTNSLSAVLAFSASKPGCTFSCQLDSEAYAPCTSPATRTVAAGSHTFSVYATDAAGNADPSPASVAWIVDVTAPTVAFTSGPSGTVATHAASFVFSASETATLQCSLDGAAFAACTSPQNLTVTADGPHHFDVQATDTAGNVGAVVTRTWTADTTAPSVTLVSAPAFTATPTHVGLVTYTFSSSDATATFQCNHDGAGLVACVSPQVFTETGDGQKTFLVRALDPVGNHTDSQTISWTLDQTAPDLIGIGGAPLSGAVANPSASYTFSSSDGTATFQCSIDGAAFAACASPKAYTETTDGNKTFAVRSVDLAGNTSATQTVSWTLDRAAPDTAIASHPASLTNATSAAFTYTSTKLPSTFHCQLDAQAATCPTAGVSYTVAEGAHTFSVYATDAAGNNDPSPASFAWTVDLTAPTVSFSSGPSGTVATHAASFVFSASETATLQCSLDGAAFAACTSPQSLTVTADGPHHFDVQATDTAGNVGAVVTRTWTADTTAPSVTLVSAPAFTATPTHVGLVTYTFSSSDATATFQCNHDGAGLVACVSPQVFTETGDGQKTFLVRALDPVGNHADSQTISWTLDQTAPDLIGIGGAPLSGAVANPSASYTFSSSDGTATFQCSIDGAAFAACASPKAYTETTDGNKTFAVRSVDLAGNTSATQTVSWTLDRAAPDTAIASHPASLTNSTSAAFTYTSTKLPSTFHCQLDAQAATCPTAGVSYTVAEGAHTFSVYATDAAGNNDPSPASFAWTVDLTAPTVSFSSGPSGTVATHAASFVFSASETATLQCSTDGAAFAACTSPQNLTVTADGPHHFDVQATDTAGNVGAVVTRTWTADTTAPSVMLSSAPAFTATPTHVGLVTYTFSSTDATATFQCNHDGAGLVACVSPQVFTETGDGQKTFLVRSLDPVGNHADSQTISWTLDQTAPDLIGIGGAPLSGAVANPSASYTFSSSDGTATFQCSIDGAPFVACASPKAYTETTDGNKTFAVRSIDLAGNTSATQTVSWTLDRAAPDTIISSHPSAFATDNAGNFTFTSDPGSTYQCSLDNASYTACNSGSAQYTVGPGAHVFRVYATDAAGNVDPSPASFSWANRSGDGHAVLIGNDFSQIAAPYTASTQPFVNALGNAVAMQPVSPVTGRIEVLLYVGASSVAKVSHLAAAILSVVPTADIQLASPADLASALIGVQVLVVADQGGSDIAGLAGTWYRPLNDFANRGGMVVVTEGIGSDGNPSATSQLLVDTGLLAIGASVLPAADWAYLLSAGSTPLVNTSNPAADLPSAPPSTVGFATLQRLTGGTYTLIADGQTVLLGHHLVRCTLSPCETSFPVIQYRAIHIVEGFDNLPAHTWPTAPWTLLGSGPAGTFVTGRDELDGISNVGWSESMFPDTSNFDDRASAWVQFPSFVAGSVVELGIHSNQGGVIAQLSVDASGTATLGTASLDSSQRESSQAAGTPFTITKGAWYRLDMFNSAAGGRFEVVLWNAQLVPVAVFDSQISGSDATGGVVFRVPANAVMDTITTFEEPAAIPFYGTAETEVDEVCPNGMGITGFYGFAGSGIDRLGVHCGTIVPAQNGATWAINAGPGVDLQWWTGTMGCVGSQDPTTCVTGSAFNEVCAANEFVTSAIITTGVANGATAIGQLQFTCSQFAASGTAGRLILSTTGATHTSNAIGTGGQQTLSATAVSCEQSFTQPDQIMNEVSVDYGPWNVYAGFTATTGMSAACRPILNW